MTTIQSMINTFGKQLNDPNGEMYLPKLILASSTPSFDPLQLHDIELGDIDLDIPGVGDVEAKFTSLAVVGLANLTIPTELIHVNGDRINATVHVSKLEPAPAGIADTIHLVGEIDAVNEKGKGIRGTLELKIEEAEVDIAGRVVLADDPMIVIEKIEFRADTSQDNIDTHIKLDGNRFLARIVNRFFDMGKVRRMIVANLNAEVASELDQLSRFATQALRQVLAE